MQAGSSHCPGALASTALLWEIPPVIRACTRNANVQPRAEIEKKKRDTGTFFIIHTHTRTRTHTHSLAVCDAGSYANTQQSSSLPVFHPPSPLQGGVISGSGWDVCRGGRPLYLFVVNKQATVELAHQ